MFNKTWLLDTLERTFRTFLQAFIGMMIASGLVDFSVPAVKAATAAGVASAGAVVLAALSALNGSPGAGVLVDAEPKA